MELDDLKNTWQDISDQAEKQQNLDPEMIDQVTRNKYHLTIKKIAVPELLGAIICFAAAVYVGFNFGMLDSIVLQGSGIVFILLMLALPLISLASIQQLKMTGDMNRSYADTLKAFAAKKIRFCKLQKINITLSYLLLATAILLSTRLFGRNWITGNDYFFISSFTLGYIILLFFSKWVFRHYNNILQQSEELLKELGS